MDDFLDKCRILYKGDFIAGTIYVLIGCLFAVLAIILSYLQISLGFTFLSIGLALFACYSLGKGLIIMIFSKRRKNIYDELTSLSIEQLNDEVTYTNFRIQKKHINRRIYTYMVIIFSVMAFLGIFTSHKALITGTSIPIALISGIEFSIGILTELRLKEFARILNKAKKSYLS
ncbi:MAG: hypothetical protein R2774_11015 [Saprospiraceae bacterium]